MSRIPFVGGPAHGTFIEMPGPAEYATSRIVRRACSPKDAGYSPERAAGWAEMKMSAVDYELESFGIWYGSMKLSGWAYVWHTDFPHSHDWQTAAVGLVIAGALAQRR